MKKKYILYSLLCLILVFIDQISKVLVTHLMSLGEEIVIIKNFFRFLYIRNTGGAFGILSNNIIMLILISIFLIYYIISEIKKNKDDKLLFITYIVILSGALGNIIDRIFRKYVVDFISFILFNREMAIFNIADIYITLGILVLIIKLIKGEKDERSSSK